MHSNNFKDLTEQTLGHVTVLELVETNPVTKWKVRCSCGNEFIAHASNMVKAIKERGDYTCLACKFKKRKAPYSLKEAEYSVWQTMKRRCLNPNSLDYGRYGGKGISVCDRWMHSYPNFIEDMGRRPDDTYTIDRINPTGNYEPDNCRWLPANEQSANRSSNILITRNGETKILKHWCNELGLNYNVVHSRYHRGKREEEIFFPTKQG